ncbi:MAG: bifunctional tRNA (5-methylaminomethyl-2-thiouridine)(34)-methyltransferase MnmD/FAD-dependent 5-carboxymethylaminomethyl-2-thiouridine(34) oxidoreductase MnmC, partial [Acidiferrobacterales bacterium]|nr:bifunctional tRNA (5-methylaminomethyl-2-thiouridine)(34)-methyltransferase MnmD/FAD-dependent 5-carboxymethylaminomethyl-2-thiouridine(34) oxidoreductase MnmC [Acidiferrobacterales bacterium]
SDGVPFSTTYQDIYFSSEHGLEESTHVFIEGSQLLQNWQSQSCFVIGETGFGTGLNFLNVWDKWQKASGKPEVLHFISVEKHPLSIAELMESHQLFPELAALSRQLVQQYPPHYSGFHRMRFSGGQVCLTLCFMDVCSAFSELGATIDCWFLDGFSPSKNPEMWSQKVFRHLARLGRQNTTVATFTSAGHVRRGLADAGFVTNKRPGYGKKREMTVGYLKQLPRIRNTEPWRLSGVQHHRRHSVFVIGAGIAGAHIAHALAVRGIKVEVLEQHRDAGMEASGNPRGIISPRLSAKPSLEEEFSINCFLKALQVLSELRLPSSAWSQCGSLDLVTNQRRSKQWQQILERNLPPSLVQVVGSQEASNIAGIPVNQPALYFPSAGWIDPKQVIHQLLNHENIHVDYDCTVAALNQKDSAWEVEIRDKNHQKQKRSAETVIVAVGTCLSQLTPTPLPIDFIAGQTAMACSTDHSENLRCVLQHEGYITPSLNNAHLIGATHQRNIQQEQESEELTQQIYDQLRKHLPDLAAHIGEPAKAHFGVRVATKTRFPLIGAIPNSHFLAHRDTLSNSMKSQHPFFPGLYIFGAFGSRGYSTTAFAAEILCSEILNEPSPARRSMRRATEPAGWFKHLKG